MVAGIKGMLLLTKSIQVNLYIAYQILAPFQNQEPRACGNNF
jgi:hypothetical protein